MVPELTTIVYAGAAGAASFFSPCAAGLLPSYIAYHFTRDQEPRIWDGFRIGGLASLGFLTLFGVIALVMLAIPFSLLTPVLPYISIGIGLLIVAIGAYLSFGGSLSIKLPRLQHNPRNVYLFGFSYALASLGCTFPLFMSVALAGSSTGESTIAAASIIAYVIAMSIVMIAMTTALTLSETSAKRFVRRAIPIIDEAAPIVMMAGGLYVIIYWIRILVVTQ